MAGSWVEEQGTILEPAEMAVSWVEEEETAPEPAKKAVSRGNSSSQT
ncbi:hypothetical protein [Paenibacillus ferrarius]|nr:hypothetical protein [Paenibacillus ferrarius]